MLGSRTGSSVEDGWDGVKREARRSLEAPCSKVGKWGNKTAAVKMEERKLVSNVAVSAGQFGESETSCL